MHIGIVSHVSTFQLREYLHLRGNEPNGTAGATAPNLLVMELLKRGHTVSVFTLTKDLKDDEEFVVHGKNLTVYYGAYRRRVRDSALSFFKRERAFLKRKILKVKPEVLHAHWQYEYAWAALDTNFRTIVTCRDSPIKILLLHKDIYRTIRLLMALIVLRKAQHLIATSEYLRRELKKLGIKKQIEVIPNFEPEWLFQLPIAQSRDLARPKIAMINNGFGKRKNAENGIRAFQIFRKSRPLAELHLYGIDYEENGVAHNWAKNNNCFQKVFFHGKMEFVDLMYELKEFTLLLHPSREETFGNTLIESMAVGTPVVGGKRSGAVPWVIGEDQKAGILADVDNPESMAHAISKVLSDNARYLIYCRNARRRAYENFSSEKVVNKYERMYSSCL
jgi:glycosyltransferase involved in cell wall biosynthesis